MALRTCSPSSTPCDWNPGDRYAANPRAASGGLSIGRRYAAHWEISIGRRYAAHWELSIGRRYDAQKNLKVCAAVTWALLILVEGSFARPQEQSRGLHVKKIEESRQPSATPTDPKQPRTYRSTTSAISSSELRKSASASEAVIGVTLWRLRATHAADNKDARILEQQSAKSAEWTAERIEADTRLNEGDRVRVSIESPSTGFLYVIDREQYADGSVGDGYAIFPTARTRGGSNSVVAGRVIEFPGQDDNPPYFTLSRSRPDHVGEMLIVIVSPQPLAELPLSSESVKVASEKLAKWEKDWGGRVEQFELEGGGGLPYTKAEKAAGGDGSRMLTQGDPLPQTILRMKAEPGAPVLVKVMLRIGRQV